MSKTLGNTVSAPNLGNCPPGGAASLQKPRASRPATALAACNFLSKGWEVSILSLLAFVQDRYSLPLYMIGILSGIFIVGQIATTFFAGKIARAISGRNSLLLSVTASGMSWLILCASGNLLMLFGAYILAGISSGLFEPIGNALVAKCSSTGSRATAIGNFAACGDMGKIAVTTAATALAGLFGLKMACGILFVSPMIAFILAIVFLPRLAEGNSVAQEAPVHLKQLIKNRKFCFATLSGICDSFSSSSLYIFIPILLKAKGIPLADTLYFNVIFFAGFIAGRLMLGRLADRYGAASMLILCNTVMAGLVLMLTGAAGVTVTVMLLFLLGIFTRGSSPVVRAMVADSMSENDSFHDAFSVYSFASRGSNAVCRPVYGFLAEATGITSVFYLASAISLLTAYPASKYKRISQRQAKDLPGMLAGEQGIASQAA